MKKFILVTVLVFVVMCASACSYVNYDYHEWDLKENFNDVIYFQTSEKIDLKEFVKEHEFPKSSFASFEEMLYRCKVSIYMPMYVSGDNEWTGGSEYIKITIQEEDGYDHTKSWDRVQWTFDLTCDMMKNYENSEGEG